MRTLFLSSGGLNEKTTRVFWECIDKEPANTIHYRYSCTTPSNEC